ncbi:WXG100-like domain-containing protein [Sphaerisporangium sp. NPDC004334]
MSPSFAMLRAPLAAFGRTAGKHPAGTTLTVATAAHGAFVSAMLGVQWPEGDPDGLRTAAGTLEGLAKSIDDGIIAADEAAKQVWTGNSGPGVEAFRSMWQGSPTPLTAFRPDGFSGYPPDVADYCRRAAAACRTYAHYIDTTRRLLVVMAVQAWANMLFTTMYAWPTAGMARFAEQAVQKYFTSLARSQLKIFNIGVSKIVQNAFYYTIDSVAYAGGQQVIQAGIYAASGVRKDADGRDVLSLRTNAVEFGQAFVANLAFDAAADSVALVPFLPGGRWGSFAARMTGSATYSIVGNLEQDPGSNPVPTDWETWVTKLLIHGTRSIKPA